MHTEVEPMYVSVFKAVAGLVNELKQKNPDAENDVQVAIDGVYGYLLLKIQKKEITDETQEAVQRISNWLSHLSKLFKDFESGDLEI
jgi:very-short-patch-repair endonuclease